MDETHYNDVGKQPPSRGIPSKEALWLADLRKLRDSWKYHQNVRLEIDQILQLVFPPSYQAKYYEIASTFMAEMLEKTELHGDEVGSFIRNRGFSKATFYNIILPRLKKIGMISLEREEFHHKKDTQKYYKKVVKLSTQFSIFWQHIAKEYESIIETARARRNSTTEVPQDSQPQESQEEQ